MTAEKAFETLAKNSQLKEALAKGLTKSIQTGINPGVTLMPPVTSGVLPGGLGDTYLDPFRRNVPNLTAGERFFCSIGLNTPFLRFAVVGLTTDVVLYFMRPRMFFDKWGRELPCSLTTHPKIPEKCYLPWWSVGLITGGLSAIFF